MKPDAAGRVQRAKLLETRKAGLNIAPVALGCISGRFGKQGKSCLRKAVLRKAGRPTRLQRPRAGAGWSGRLRLSE